MYINCRFPLQGLQFWVHLYELTLSIMVSFSWFHTYAVGQSSKCFMSLRVIYIFWYLAIIGCEWYRTVTRGFSSLFSSSGMAFLIQEAFSWWPQQRHTRQASADSYLITIRCSLRNLSRVTEWTKTMSWPITLLVIVSVRLLIGGWW